MARSGTSEIVPEEANLIRQARRGDAAAWELLVRQHQAAVFRLGYLLLRSPAEAEDVAQEAFVRAFVSLDRFDEERPFQPWLLQITRNLAKNRLRSLSRYWGMVKRWWWEADTAVTATSLSQNESAQLWQAVQRLRPHAQEVIYLRYFLELSEAETAVALNVPSGTVKSRLHRALQQLKLVIELDFVELKEVIG
ncbi:MAG: RNA polymerase sigma factor [Ardenticatenaceae bacterium]|nr:RNA polymerase sigma factor [Anaerolineales bacterium]MCB8938742.1 RNA polymerase sigma factor [Ardenticatenaceae bacterium]MCB8973978.1 RNA polymerase sigma factor [Ardenticatenaceae bacterium]